MKLINEKFDELYNSKARTINAYMPNPNLQDFDKIIQNIDSKDFGKLLKTQEEQEAKSSKETKQEISVEADKLIGNLSRKQMTYLIKSVESYEDFSKKNWLNRTLSNIASSIRNICKSSKKLKQQNDFVHNGVVNLATEAMGFQESVPSLEQVKENEKITKKEKKKPKAKYIAAKDTKEKVIKFTDIMANSKIVKKNGIGR